MSVTRIDKSRRADFEAGRQRFLNAADRVYIEWGYAGSTIRAISDEAETSLARLNRHWSGKHELFKDVFERHFGAIHDAQLSGLDRIEASNFTGVALLSAVIEVFVSPAFQSLGQTDQTARQVYCRAMVDPAPEVRTIVEGLVAPVRQRLIANVRRALPEVSEESLFIVLSAMFGAYVYPQLFGQGLAASMGLPFERLDWSKAAQQLADLFRQGVGKLEVSRVRTH